MKSAGEARLRRAGAEMLCPWEGGTKGYAVVGMPAGVWRLARRGGEKSAAGEESLNGEYKIAAGLGFGNVTMRSGIANLNGNSG